MAEASAARAVLLPAIGFDFQTTVPTIALTGYVQAQHIDTDFYDEHFAPGAYLETHAAHMERWHPGEGSSRR